MIRLGVLGAALLTLTLAGVSLHVPGALGVGSPELKNWFVLLLGISMAVYLVAVMHVVRGAPVRRGIWVVLLVAGALRLPLILAPAFLSTDLYRYIWDGRVQAEGINPYRYIPNNPALAPLRDDFVYPKINRFDTAPTIYPPAAQIVFAVIGRVWSSVTAVKLVMVGFEALAIACLLRLLAMAGLPAERVLIYAWNPLPAWAFAGNGHIDAVAIGLVALALLLRARHRDVPAGIALGLAILTKFLPVVVAPVLWRRRSGWRIAAAALAVIIVLYACYSSVGLRVFGFLSGYGDEEGYRDGSGYWVLAVLSHAVRLPAGAVTIYLAVFAAVLALLGLFYAFHRRPDDPQALCAAAGVMMAVLTVGISPHYPWYFAWLSVPCVLAPAPAIVWLGAAPILLYLETHGDRFGWPSVIYVPALLLAVAGLHPARAFQPIKGNT